MERIYNSIKALFSFKHEIGINLYMKNNRIIKKEIIKGIKDYTFIDLKRIKKNIKKFNVSEVLFIHSHINDLRPSEADYNARDYIYNNLSEVSPEFFIFSPEGMLQY